MSVNSARRSINQTIVAIIKEDNPQTTEQLVTLAQQQLQLPASEILEAVLRLQNEGRIRLTQPTPHPSSTITAHPQPARAYWLWMIALTMMATTVAVVLIPDDLHPWVYIRYVLGAIFVLWLPGYAFIRALFPASTRTPKTPERLDTVERNALSVGMSLVLVPVVGFVLNYTPWGIRLTSIVLSLVAFTSIFAAAAVLREHQDQPPNKR